MIRATHADYVPLGPHAILGAVPDLEIDTWFAHSCYDLSLCAKVRLTVQAS